LLLLFFPSCRYQDNYLLAVRTVCERAKGDSLLFGNEKYIQKNHANSTEAPFYVPPIAVSSCAATSSSNSSTCVSAMSTTATTTRNGAKATTASTANNTNSPRSFKKMLSESIKSPRLSVLVSTNAGGNVREGGPSTGNLAPAPATVTTSGGSAAAKANLALQLSQQLQQNCIPFNSLPQHLQNAWVQICTNFSTAFSNKDQSSSSSSAGSSGQTHVSAKTFDSFFQHTKA
jgi:hypothetical protein